ncbi:Hydrogenase isoenzymes formation protein hypE [Rhynchospora pubera]|uniref:Hydrogenase isoenzymes formation protein hypE n=1 Tax=Rhynchospora pubera TaxID=906938 RepID=A0AAV8CE88_9POAL|nr:Hydrogenase isoenzymes formation protein hypE [Rhynchospora pubera]
MALSLFQSLHFPNQALALRFNGPRFRITSPFPSFTTRIRSSSKDESANPLDQVVDLRSNGRAPQSSFDFLELKRELEKEKEKDKGREREEEANQTESTGGGELERRVRSRGRQMVGRSSLLAKQVVSVKSARSLGFISQLWVDTSMWVVALVETRPNLLSGEMEKFLLEDVCQVGDVVLVHDESVLENELNLVGLESLVGYNVTTTGRRDVGKVRGYTFNINSGAVDCLELDSFGLSLIPSSLVSTYSLLVDDILEVASDTVVVDEDVVSRLQRVTKGIWGSQNIRKRDQMGAYSEFERRSRSMERNHREKPSGRRYRRRMVHDTEDDDWEFPMDY